MAIATTGAHVSRALEFYNKASNSGYFSISKNSPWEDDGNPPVPSPGIFRVEELIALKKIDKISLVVEITKDEAKEPSENTINYRDTYWRKINPVEVATSTSNIISEGVSTIHLQSLANLSVGSKLRINNEYEGVILSMSTTDSTVVLDTQAPKEIPSKAPVIGGAYVEGARHVYVECALNYDKFPLKTYRQVGVMTGVIPANPEKTDILLSAAYSISKLNEYTSLGVLEILDNRAPTVREADQKEQISLIIQF